MDQVPQRLAGWWSRLDEHGRRHASVLLLIALGYLGHYLVYCIGQPFFIEDAGISFAYARNLVDGEGLVTYAGGERVEGYSNALWTFLIAAFYAVGVPAWSSSKLLGAVFGLLTLPMVYDLVRRARPGRPDDVALAAPILLAASPQFVIWNASGLENSLFCVLITAGVWRLVVEMEAEVSGGRRRWPVSAVWFFLLTMTRPEGLMYASIGLFARVLGSVASRRPLATATWVATFAVPFGLYNAWRLWYFAWPFPNTYYAKLGKGTSFRPFSWTGGGWKYIKKYLVDHGVVYVLPLLAFALAPLRRRRRWVGILALVVLSVLVLWDGRQGIKEFEPAWWGPIRRDWVEIRVWGILVFSGLLGLTTLGLPGWRARGLLWANTCASVFFILYSGADWMKAHRWFNLVSVSLFPMLAIGLGSLLDALPAMGFRLRLPAGPAWLQRGVAVRPVVLALPLAVWIGSEANHSNQFALRPETAVRDIHRRVLYMGEVQRKLDLDNVTLLDVDMGAHMYFTNWQIVDIAGLVDVPMARHRRYAKPFVREYLFDERKPDFAHVHAGWARSSKIPTHKEWKDRYLEIPGYPIGEVKLHVGNHIRKDLFVTATTDDPPEDALRFDGGVDLISLDVPSPLVPAGGELFVDTVWQAGFREDFRAMLFMDDGRGHRTVQALQPGYGWYSPDEWKARERVAGRFRVPLPDDLPEGSYRLGIVVMDGPTGEVLALQAEDAAASPIVMVEGEWLSELEVQVVAPARAYEEASLDHAAALDAARGGSCDAAWRRFKDGTRHVLADLEWRAAREPEARRAMAACLVDAASQVEAREEQVALLVSARRWDRHLSALLAAARPLAAEMSAEGQLLADDEAWEAAYPLLKQALDLDPRLSWVRRRAEEVRDHRLGLVKEEEPEEDKDSEDDGPKLPDSRREAGVEAPVVKGAKAAKGAKSGKVGKAAKGSKAGQAAKAAKTAKVRSVKGSKAAATGKEGKASTDSKGNTGFKDGKGQKSGKGPTPVVPPTL